MVGRETHNLCSGCTYRTIHANGVKDMYVLQPEMHGLDVDAQVHPYSHAALDTTAKSKPFCFITSIRRDITRSHGACPAMLWVMQDIRLGAMQQVQEVLQSMQLCVQTS